MWKGAQPAFPPPLHLRWRRCVAWAPSSRLRSAAGTEGILQRRPGQAVAVSFIEYPHVAVAGVAGYYPGGNLETALTSVVELTGRLHRRFQQTAWSSPADGRRPFLVSSGLLGGGASACAGPAGVASDAARGRTCGGITVGVAQARRPGAMLEQLTSSTSGLVCLGGLPAWWFQPSSLAPRQ